MLHNENELLSAIHNPYFGIFAHKRFDIYLISSI